MLSRTVFAVRFDADRNTAFDPVHARQRWLLHRLLAVDDRGLPFFLADAVRLVRRRRPVSGRRFEQAAARRFADEGGIFFLRRPQGTGKDAFGAELGLRAWPRCLFDRTAWRLAAARGRPAAAAGALVLIRQQRTVVHPFDVRLAVAFRLLFLSGLLDVRIVGPAGGLGGGVGFRRRQRLDRRQHQRRTLAVLDAGPLVAAQPQSLEDAAHDLGVERDVFFVVVGGARTRRGAADHQCHADRGGDRDPAEFALGTEADHAVT